MIEKINTNGFEFVDLGLPSGTLWSTKNIGASTPSDFGLYFQWGDTSGYTAEQVGYDDGKKAFKWDDYKWNVSEGFTKYNTAGEALNLEDDAANANMGGSWHIPSSEQIQELINETTSNWIKLDGVNGKLFTSKNGKSIFIPAAGYAWDGSLLDSGSDGYVWSSMLSTDSVYSGQNLNFDSGYVSLNVYNRGSGFSIRGVIG